MVFGPKDSINILLIVIFLGYWVTVIKYLWHYRSWFIGVVGNIWERQSSHKVIPNSFHFSNTDTKKLLCLGWNRSQKRTKITPMIFQKTLKMLGWRRWNCLIGVVMFCICTGLLSGFLDLVVIFFNNYFSCISIYCVFVMLFFLWAAWNHLESGGIKIGWKDK